MLYYRSNRAFDPLPFFHLFWTNDSPLIGIEKHKIIGVPIIPPHYSTLFQERFSYHMWVEALVAENLWVAVDPAMGQIEPDALHLKLFHGDLDYNTHTNMTWTLIQSLKSDDLKIVELNKTF